MIYNSREYIAIKDFYGDRIAKRSQVPLMNHINEGIDLLQKWGRSIDEQKAFAIHPIVQNGENVDVSWSTVLPLAEEYRDKANSYLCRPETDYITTPEQLSEIIGNISIECCWLLLADKVQNQKDFRIYHWFTHNRNKNLEKYFNIWIWFLYVKVTNHV